MKNKIEIKFINKPDLSILDNYFYESILNSITDLLNQSKSRN